ncbi:metallopeptidase family protein [Pelagerythrobacter rhizovicinus]|uniref:Metallopeptidase family protein n=1 Tax=Pelagerythrobacter rhizovicinus TaxID=2268576 RepID=A0A4Q2KKV9_9SPHN|nr:metallopeptidase family protein [Pelagerythrobacter rhizovicinus]RXZ65945.1 metallopeptidase family protein [Pelagerythrobacter rhizovicinus]
MEAFRHAPPTAEDMERMAQAVIDSLPEEFREPLRQVVVRIEEFATREQLDSVDIRSKWNLTGLYEGRPLDEQSIWDPGDLPPVISLFRQPLVREWRETGVDFADLVRHVVIHEAGHHFGFSDEEMHWLEESVDDELAP